MPSQRPAVDGKAVRGLSGSGTVLWVGSESRVGSWLAEWFENVASTNNTDEALALLDENTFLFALVDIAGDEGLKFVRRAYETFPSLAVVAIVSSNVDILVELFHLGVGAVVLAPVDERSLLERLHQELLNAQDREKQSKYLRRLESEVRLRTNELLDSQVEVVRLQEAKDNMLALISHEIRTPLNGILGFIDLLRSPDFVSDVPAFLVHVEESARRLERSTRKALDFASLSTGLRAPRHQPHRVQALLEAAQEQLGARADGLVVWRGPDTLTTDGELAVQVFRNVLENSAKYGGPSPSVTVSLTREGRWDVLTFRDTGPGFSASVLSTLFQPFSTGGILHHSEGMGLGLALVDVIMLTLGGRAEAGNAEGGGAVVKLRFPLREG